MLWTLKGRGGTWQTLDVSDDGEREQLTPAKQNFLQVSKESSAREASNTFLSFSSRLAGTREWKERDWEDKKAKEIEPYRGEVQDVRETGEGKWMHEAA